MCNKTIHRQGQSQAKIDPILNSITKDLVSFCLLTLPSVVSFMLGGVPSRIPKTATVKTQGYLFLRSHLER